MDLLNLREIEEHLHTLVKIPEDDSIVKGEFTPIDCNLFIIRLSAGLDCFCKPRIGCYTNIMDYTHIQVMIQEKLRSNLDLITLITPAGDSRFKGFGWSKYFHYDDFKGKTNDSYIGSNVPVEEVPRLIKDAYKISRLKIFF